MLLVALLWGSAFPAIKRSYVLLGVAPGDLRVPVLFAGLRFLTAGVALVVVAGLAGLRPRPGRRELGWLLLLGLLQTTLQYSAFYVGLAYTTGIQAAIIVAANSFFLALLSPLVFPAERMTAGRWLGLAVGFGGVVVANLHRTAGFGDVQWLGDLLILCTAAFSALASIVGKRLVPTVHPVLLNGLQLCIGATVLLAATLPWGPLTPPAFDAELVWLTAYLVGVTAVSFSLYYLVLQHHELTRVAAYRFLIPLCGVLESALLIPGEAVGMPLLLATGLVAAGIWIVNRPVGPGADA